jgi:flagellar biosynthesis protein FlhF
VSPPSNQRSGKTYRFVVGSAAEAATAIREKLGEKAKVISVRQVEGEGLARFLRAPKLEIIAHVPPEEPLPTPEAEFRIPDDTTPFVPPLSENDEKFPADSEIPALEESRLLHMLKRAGLPESFLLRFAQEPEWQRLQTMPLASAFPKAVLHLRSSLPKRTLPAIARRVAFFGAPGAGSTTALCKQLATEVFLRNRSACVMKIDGEDPNATEALAMYCEALGIPLLRSTAELLKVDDEMIVYFDIPGAISDAKNHSRLKQAMTSHGIATRVLVVNAAYDCQLIKHFYQESAALGATHVVFTHLDELHHFGKLWEFVLDADLTPLFASTGPNLADDCERDLVGHLVHKTLTAGKATI